MLLRFRSHLLLILLVALSGCLPYSCNRVEQRALLPADSLSRSYAASLPVDTLRHVWSSAGPEDALMTFPRTVLFAEDGRVHVADPEQQGLYTFAPDGAPQPTVVLAEDAQFPYLIGRRADTLFVFSPDQRRIDAYLDGEHIRSLPTPVEVPERGTLQYALATDSSFFVKVLGEDFPGYLARLDDAGNETGRLSLSQSAWRYAGFLRAWQGDVISLVGYRPLVDVWPQQGPMGMGTPDSLVLFGFDSPMLARSRLFLEGEEHQAPLLTSSAAPAGDLLFLLNMRPGWLRIDAFDRAGQLQRQLVQPNPGFSMEFFPQDLAVREVAPGQYEFAVITTQPTSEVHFFRWQAE